MKPIYSTSRPAACSESELSYTSRFERRRDIKPRATRRRDRRTATVALKSPRISASSLLSLHQMHQMQWSTRPTRPGAHGGRSSYKAKRPQPDPGGDRDSAFATRRSSPSPARGTVLLVFIWCPSAIPCMYLSFCARSLALPLHDHRAHRHVRCGKIVENKLVCRPKPIPFSRAFFSLNLFFSLSLIIIQESIIHYIELFKLRFLPLCAQSSLIQRI